MHMCCAASDKQGCDWDDGAACMWALLQSSQRYGWCDLGCDCWRVCPRVTCDLYVCAYVGTDTSVRRVDGAGDPGVCAYSAQAGLGADVVCG